MKFPELMYCTFKTTIYAIGRGQTAVSCIDVPEKQNHWKWLIPRQPA